MKSETINEMKETFSEKHPISKVLLILFIIAIIYESITFEPGIAGIILLILLIFEFCLWFFKKEED